MPRAICRVVGYWRQSAAIPRPFLAALAAKAWGLATVKCNVILLHYDAPPPCRRGPSIAGPFAVIAAAVRAQAPGARRRLDRADLGRGAVGLQMTSSAVT